MRFQLRAAMGRIERKMPRSLWTVTVKDPLPVLPAPSVAVQVTVVAPSGKLAPEAGEHEGVSDVDPSCAEAVYVTATEVAPLIERVMVDGTVTTGGWLSRTVTEKVPWPVLPEVSVAEQLTFVVPSGKVAPEAGEQVTAGLAGPSVAVTGP